MYRIVLGNVSVLSASEVPSALTDRAPDGARHARWLAGR
ncbi:ACP synthase, partial [Klebsiella pneumoniae]